MRDFKNTLILGDLVYNHRKWVCPVVGLDSQYITVIAHHYGESPYKREDVSLIELTDEIIEQLGWKEIKEGDPDYRRNISLEKEFKHPDYSKELNITKNSISGLYHILKGNITLRYVSDLNHVIFHKFNDRINWDEEQKFHIISKPLSETVNEC